MRHARSELHLDREIDRFAWWVPVLTVCGAPEHVIRCDVRALGKRAVSLMQSGQYDQVKLFVDRITIQQQIWRNVCGEMDDPRKRKLVLVSGKASAGKTQLLRSCMLAWRLLDRPGALVCMQGVPDRNNLGTKLVLIQICKALLDQAHPPESCRSQLDEFIARVQQINQDSPGGGEAESPYDGVCAELRRILLEAAADGPLLLALDQAEGIFPYDFFGPFYRKFLHPVAQDRGGPIHIIFAFRESGALTDMIEREKTWDYCVQTVTVDMFTKPEARHLGREYGVRKGREGAEWRELLDVNLKINPAFQGPHWMPSDLQKLAGLEGQQFLEQFLPIVRNLENTAGLW